MVRPIKVEAGEWDEGVDNLLEKAKELDIRLKKATTETDNSEMRSIGGVEEARPAHYYTNQQLPDTPEDVSKTTQSSGESVRFLQANPHDDGGAASAHMTDGGHQTGQQVLLMRKLSSVKQKSALAKVARRQSANANRAARTANANQSKRPNCSARGRKTILTY